MKMTLRTAAIAASTVVCATLWSFGWSDQSGVSLSVTKAEAQRARSLYQVWLRLECYLHRKPFLVRREGLLFGWPLEWSWVQLQRLA